MDRFEIRLRALRRWLLVLTIGEERSFEPLIIPVVPQRPPESGGLGAFEVVKNGGLANPEYLRGVFEVAYITGWRTQSELVSRQWKHVDLKDGGWLRLEPGEGKNREGRMFPVIPQLRDIIDRQRAYTNAVNVKTGRINPWVFHNEGQPIKDYRGAWKTACKKAGLVGRIPHDFRRKAVRNLEKAGVARSSAMKMVGHKTEAIYRRYAIVDRKCSKRRGPSSRLWVLWAL